MLSTFRHAPSVTREPRNRLLPGVTAYYQAHHCHSRTKPTGQPQLSPPPNLPPIPESAAQFALETLRFPADPLQQDLLAAAGNRVIVCCTRQWGKSSLAAIKALHHALRSPGSLTLLTSRTSRQSGELLAKVTAFARSLGLPIRRAQPHAGSLLLPNGARIIALPGRPDALRGFSAVSLLVIDEAAYVEDELYWALRPMLATTDGAVWLLSTPRGRTGFFYDEWSSEGAVWTKVMVKAEQCPRISPEFLDQERRLHGPALFLREYGCDFGFTGQSYFDIGALDESMEPEHWLAAQSFALGRPVTRIVVGFDLGQRQSHSALVALEVITGPSSRRDPVTFNFINETHMIVRRIERLPLGVPYDSIVSRIHRILRDLGDTRIVTLAVDATGCGQPFVELLTRRQMGALICPIAITSGTQPNLVGNLQHVPKKDLLANANYLLTTGYLAAPPGMTGFRELKEEMEAYRVRTSRNGYDSFRSNSSDDLVMAYSLAAWRARTFFPRSLPAPSRHA